MPSVLQLGEPAQGAQTRQEAVLAAAGDHEAGQVLQAAPDRLLRDGGAAGSAVVPGYRVLLAGVADEVAVVDPLGLDEFELSFEVGPDEDSDQAPVGAVVLQHALWQRRAVGGAAADEAVHPCVADDGGIAGVDAPDVRTGGAPEAAIVVLPVQEVVVAVRIGAQLRVIVLRGQRQRRPAGPAPDHLRRQERLLLGAGGVRAQVLAPGRHLGVDLAHGHVGPVAPQHIGAGHGRQIAGFVGVAEDELAGLDGGFLGVGAGQPDALDVRMADAVAEAEGGAPGRELVDLLLPDHL